MPKMRIFKFDDGTETLPNLTDTQGMVYYDGTNSYLSVTSGNTVTLDVAIDPVDSDNLFGFDERMRGFKIYWSREDEGYVQRVIAIEDVPLEQGTWLILGRTHSKLE